MIKKHNFISKSYLEERSNKDQKLYQAAIILMILLNAILFQRYYNDKQYIEENKSRLVFRQVDKKVQQSGNKAGSFIVIYKEIMGYLKGDIKVTNLKYQDGLTQLELLSSKSTDYIQFVKDIEEKRKFTILKVSPIENTEKGFKLIIGLKAI